MVQGWAGLREATWEEGIRPDPRGAHDGHQGVRTERCRALPREPELPQRDEHLLPAGLGPCPRDAVPLLSQHRRSDAPAGGARAHVRHGVVGPGPDIDRTDLFVVIGGNPLVSNGSLMTVPTCRAGCGSALRPRRTHDRRRSCAHSDSHAAADEHLPIRPGPTCCCLAAMVNVLFADGLVDLGAAAAWRIPTGVARIPANCSALHPEAVAGPNWTVPPPKSQDWRGRSPLRMPLRCTAGWVRTSTSALTVPANPPRSGRWRPG